MKKLFMRLLLLLLLPELIVRRKARGAMRRSSLVGFGVFFLHGDREGLRRHLHTMALWHDGLGGGRVDALAHERQRLWQRASASRGPFILKRRR